MEASQLIGEARSAFNSHLAEGETLLRRGDYLRAIDCLTRALDLLPDSVAVLLQRGNAYMNLGRAVEAIADADRVLQVEKRIQDKLEGNAPVVNGVRRYKRPPPNFRALLLKAESLFLAGKFEYAMVYFHQGHRARKDIPEFELGVEKCKTAIKDSILQENITANIARYGGAVPSPRAPGPPAPQSALSPRSGKGSSSMGASGGFVSSPRPPAGSPPPHTRTRSLGGSGVPTLNLSTMPNIRDSLSSRLNTSRKSVDGQAVGGDRPTASAQSERLSSRKLLGELYSDQQFLKDLLHDDTLTKGAVGKETDVSQVVKNGLTFLNARQEFWRQQNPPTSTPRAGGGSTTRRNLGPKFTGRSSLYRDQQNPATLTSRSAPGEASSSGQQYTQRGAPLTERAAATVVGGSSSQQQQQLESKSQQKPGAKKQRGAQTSGAGSGGSGVEGSASGSKQKPGVSRKKYLEQTKYAIQTLESINEAIEEGELEVALKYSKNFLSRLAALDLSDKPKILANLYSLMGTTYMELNKLTLAVIHHRKDLDIAVRYDFKDAYLRALENLGVTYEKMGDYAQSIRMWEKKLEFCDGAEKGRLWEDIARCYYQLGDCADALQFAQRAFEHGVDTDDQARQMSAQYTLGHTLCKMGKFQDAIPCFEGYLAIARVLGDQVAEANALTDLGNAYLQLQDTAKSIKYQQEALQLSSRLV